MTASRAVSRSRNSTSSPSRTPSWAWCPTTVCTSSRNGIAASRSDTRRRRPGAELPQPHARPGPPGRRPAPAARGPPARRPAGTPSPRAGRCAGRSPPTVSAGWSAVKASSTRTARARTDSPVGVRDTAECGTGLSSIEKLSSARRDAGRILATSTRRSPCSEPHQREPHGGDVGAAGRGEDARRRRRGHARPWSPRTAAGCPTGRRARTSTCTLANGLTRQYSLCGDRWDAAHLPRRRAARAGRPRRLRLRARRSWQPGRPGRASAARGTTSRWCPPESYLFVAGGIGITPLLPMMRQADLLGADWRLLYGGRQPRLDGLPRRAGRPTATGCQVVARRTSAGCWTCRGFLGEPRAGVRVYCCGPAPLLAALEARLHRRGRRTPCTPSGSSPTEQAAPVRTTAVRGRAGPHRHDGHRHPGHDRAGGGRPRRGRGAHLLPAGHLRHLRDRRSSPACPTTATRLLDDDERAAGRLHVHLRLPGPLRPPRPRPLTSRGDPP